VATEIGFVILTWNSEKYIGKCLESICGIKEDVVSHIVVIDNGSIDGSAEIVRQRSDNWSLKLLKLEKNHGTTCSRNKGISALLEEYQSIQFLCILDSDTEINGDCLLKLVNACQTEQNVGIVGPRMHDENGIYQESGRSIPTLCEKLLKIVPIKRIQAMGERMQQVVSPCGDGCVPVGYLMSACWLMPVKTLGNVGLFDERIFYAPEDVDYCLRVWECGLRVLHCYDADMLHHWQRLSKKKLFSKHNYEHLKGLAYLFVKHKYLFSNRKFKIE